ncbi:hypothetical protein K438DRAFT_1941835 [Mycena galopus ATCC 62051]|nr:hypothetical protein K438DRAFT_1941835 [Mycena galopus ATCC 62051]
MGFSPHSQYHGAHLCLWSPSPPTNAGSPRRLQPPPVRLLGNVHADFSRGVQFPTIFIPQEVETTYYATWWVTPASTAIFVAFFAFGREAVEAYKRGFACVGRGIEVVRRSVLRGKGAHLAASSSPRCLARRSRAPYPTPPNLTIFRTASFEEVSLGDVSETSYPHSSYALPYQLTTIAAYQPPTFIAYPAPTPSPSAEEEEPQTTSTLAFGPPTRLPFPLPLRRAQARISVAAAGTYCNFRPNSLARASSWLRRRSHSSGADSPTRKAHLPSPRFSRYCYSPFQPPKPKRPEFNVAPARKLTPPRSSARPDPH